jgi:hypothetical protein
MRPLTSLLLSAWLVLPLAAHAQGAGAPTPVTLTPARPRVGFAPLLGFGAGVGAASAAGGVLLGAGLGVLSNHLLGALLPGALLANLIFPPLVTALAMWGLGNLGAPGRFSLWLPLLGAFAGNAALYLVVALAVPFAVAWSNPVALLVYALLDAAVMAGATGGVMALVEQKPAVLTLRSLTPGAPDLVSASLSRVEF